MSEVWILKHVPFEGPGTILDELKKRGMSHRDINLYESPVPGDLEGCRGLVIMGGPMNVYEEAEYPFLKDEDRLIREALAKKMPMLGVCLGAQLMAKAAGARVIKGEKKEIGWYNIALTREAKDDAVFGALPKDVEVFQWHGDTFDIPEGAVRLASSELFPNQAFCIGNNGYALQFHIEVTEEIIREWVSINDQELASVKDYIDSGIIIEKLRAGCSRLEQTSGLIYDRLFSIF